jgi:hypothetical protein
VSTRRGEALEKEATMLEIAEVEQGIAWLERLRGDHRPFDYVHGFISGLACAAAVVEIDEVLFLLPFLPDPEHAVLPKGLDKADIADYCSALLEDVNAGLQEGSFRPYMGGRFVGRIKADTPCEQWCLGFIHSSLAFADEARGEEGLSFLMTPALILASKADDPESVLEELQVEDRAAAIEKARAELLASVTGIYDFLRGRDLER